MTKRLSALLQEEAATLHVPTPQADLVLTDGRRLRRRRRLGYAVGALAIVTVIGTGVALAMVGDERKRAVDPAATPADGPVFAVGTTVYLDGGAISATVDHPVIRSLFYTSAGVLALHVNFPHSDVGGHQRFSLVTSDGDVRPVSGTTAEFVSTDPAQPYLAYAETVDDATYVVLRDVRDDSEAARIELPDGPDYSWSPGVAPPVDLEGDRVYVGTQDVMRYVDWRTGESGTVDTVPGGYPDIQGGRAVVRDGDRSSVVDVATGQRLLDLVKGSVYLSPDGRYAISFENPTSGRLPLMTAYSLDASAQVTLDGAFSVGAGMSPAGDLFTVDGSKLTTCDSDDGTCKTTQLDLTTPPGDPESFVDDLVLGGITRVP